MGKSKVTETTAQLVGLQDEARRALDIQKEERRRQASAPGSASVPSAAEGDPIEVDGSDTEGPAAGPLAVLDKVAGDLAQSLPETGLAGMPTTQDELLQAMRECQRQAIAKCREGIVALGTGSAASGSAAATRPVKAEPATAAEGQAGMAAPRFEYSAESTAGLVELAPSCIPTEQEFFDTQGERTRGGVCGLDVDEDFRWGSVRSY